MSEQNWWQRTIAAINREYERRIRRASLVSEYGADHHHHGPEDGHVAEASQAEHDEGEVAEILNVPKGTRIARHTPPESPADAERPPS